MVLGTFPSILWWWTTYSSPQPTSFPTPSASQQAHGYNPGASTIAESPMMEASSAPWEEANWWWWPQETWTIFKKAFGQLQSLCHYGTSTFHFCLTPVSPSPTPPNLCHRVWHKFVDSVVYTSTLQHHCWDFSEVLTAFAWHHVAVQRGSLWNSSPSI